MGLYKLIKALNDNVIFQVTLFEWKMNMKNISKLILLLQSELPRNAPIDYEKSNIRSNLKIWYCTKVIVGH